ncbi:tail fiber domain-containing protein [uncultured Mucilaginibacter sp.]|uniref:tail fiber domain-containing protein n=1 Tax=uncultured Mucilaginibacter sp. TaxID=797541 RepID=UPI0026185F85|nr:tail fiber domain-containing protein [uncultured Mucilaginibacter sp.]
MKTFKLISKAFIGLCCLLATEKGLAQNVGISATSGFTPDASAGLDVSYSNKGLLVPRVALTATNAAGPITSPAISLLVYNTATAGTAPNNVTPGYYYWNGVAWTALSTGTQTANSAWATTGNTGINYKTNFLGTTDNQSLRFRTNNAQRFLLDSLGNAAIGSAPVFSANAEKLLVDAGTTSSFNVISGKGNLNNYLQLNIQNNNAGTSASSDVVATADNGTESVNYVDMGINSSANTSAFYGAANDAYLYNAGGSVGGNFFIGTSTAGKSLGFLTGGGASSNERMRIDGNGNVGIGTTTPSQKLDVNGSINAATSLISQGSVFIDAAITNTGALSPGLILGGIGSGESISSKRTSGTNQYGIDFYTAGANRMSINNGGNIGIGNNVPTEKLDVTGNLKFSGALMPNNNAGTAGYFLQSTGAGTSPLWVSPAASSAWATTGNTGTTAGTNFIGTTDAQDMVFKANNVERMRIVNGASTTTGTTGDITIGDANSGTLRSTKELVMRQDGDLYGPSTLRLRNRAGQNGAVFETTGGSANLVDFIFNTGAVASPISSNIRFETRSTNMKVTGNTTEWQFGQPDVVNGGPTLVTGASGTGSNSAFLIGKVGIGNNAPTEKLDVTGNLKFSGALMPNNNAGTAGYILQSAGAGTPPVWVSPGAGQGWGLAGNAGTTAGTNFIGTTDAQDFVVKTNNTEKMRVASTGDVAIGGTAFNSTNPEQLLVDAGTTSSFNVISGKGNLNNYLQLNIQNNNAGAGASSDVVASNNTATEAVNYVDMGINSSGNTSTGVIGGASTAYLYATGNDFAIGNGTANKNLMFFTGGTGSTERMRIDGTGNMGIGTTAPSQKLDVNGNINTANSIYLDAAGANTGTSGQGLLGPGLYFGGSASGETISSKRNAGTDQFGLDFYTSSNNRMTIASGGNVGIGTNAPGYKLTVAGIVAPTIDNTYSLGVSTTNRWTTVYTVNGVSQTSDRRLKTNITNLNYGLKEVLALQPVGYNWKEKPTAEHKIGLIAQDVRKIVPEVVVGDETKEKLGMNYAELVPVLINAIKEQQKEIDDLKKAVQKLQQ